MKHRIIAYVVIAIVITLLIFATAWIHNTTNDMRISRINMKMAKEEPVHPCSIRNDDREATSMMKGIFHGHVYYRHMHKDAMWTPRCITAKNNWTGLAERVKELNSKK